MAILKSLNEQSPATKNQITNEKPSIIKNSNILQGYFANSINGGHIKPITYKYVMAGEKHMEYRLQASIKMLTPLTPCYQRLKAVFKAYFVPNSRVWTNAEKFLSQKGGSTESKIKKIPNLGGRTIPTIQIGTQTENKNVGIFDTDLWRDSWANCYIPKYLTGLESGDLDTMPEYSILPFRGFKAIYNDFERNKEYDEELTEFKGDDVTAAEANTIFYRTSTHSIEKFIIRGKRQNSYYTDYRTELLGEETTEPSGTGNGAIINLTEWEKQVAELRSQAENAQANDWDIIAKIRGSKKLSEGKVQLLGTKTVGLNYQAITQNAYNTNTGIKEEFQTMGTQGAYSYTEVDIPLYQMVEFNEEGYIHIIMQVTADTVYETGFERTGLNINYNDIYRPDLKDLKHDVLYQIEKDGATSIKSNQKKVDGFKRKFSEYFKLPQPIGGDMTTTEPYETVGTKVDTFKGTEQKTKIQTNKTFQFFEIDDRYTENYAAKKIWKDYTDLLINKNMAIKQEEEAIGETGQYKFIRVKGQNQIFFIGMATCVCDLPIDENIRKNYTTWGEK